ncbi:MAG: Flp family type IVb pilin [Deltaproteobacteria bacterium]|nr:Flp family type IVb pilin [Deltaproteobacteria bacterium]
MKEDIKTSVKGNEKKEEGASLVEYALLLALIAVVCIVAIRVIGTKASAQFSSIAGQL